MSVKCDAGEWNVYFPKVLGYKPHFVSIHWFIWHGDSADSAECVLIYFNLHINFSVSCQCQCECFSRICLCMILTFSSFFSQRILCLYVLLYIAAHCLFIVIRKWDIWDGDFEGEKRNGKKPNILCMCTLYNMCRSLFFSWFVISCARIYTLTTWKKTQFIHFNSCPVCQRVRLLVCGVFILLDRC